MKKMLILMYFAAVCAAGADTVYVSPDGGNVMPYASWADASTSIQLAVNAAGDGDVVLVTNGTYTISSTLTIDDGVTVKSVNGCEMAVLSAQGVRCVMMSNAVLDGFTVTNGYYIGNGAGIYCYTGAILNCKVTGNIVPLVGGRCGMGIYCMDTLITNCDIVGNMSPSDSFGSNHDLGGGVYCSDSTIIDCRIRTNFAGYGGGVCMGGQCEMRGCLVSGNAVMASGGGVLIWNDGCDVIDCQVIGNRAGTMGGGLYLAGGGLITDSLISENSAWYRIGDTLSAPQGGGAYVSGGRIERCVISANTGGLGGGLYLSGSACLDSVIMGNYCSDDTTMGPPNGGGICVGGASTVENCTVVSNQAHDGIGGVLVEYGSVEMGNCIIYDNVGTNLQIGSGSIHDSCIQNWTSLTDGNISNDPQFASASDYHLSETSPCINAGQNSVRMTGMLDVDGEGRIIRGLVDMGADEYFEGMSLDTDLNLGAGTCDAIWSALTNAVYELQCAEDLLNPAWSTVGGAVTATTEIASRTDAALGSVTQRYYRVKLIQWPE